MILTELQSNLLRISNEQIRKGNTKLIPYFNFCSLAKNEIELDKAIKKLNGKCIIKEFI